MVRTAAATTDEAAHQDNSTTITELPSKRSADPHYPTLWRFETDGDELKLIGDWGGNPPEEYGSSPDPIERDYHLETRKLNEYCLWRGTNYINSGATYTRKKTIEIRLLLKHSEGDWKLAEPDFTPRYGYDGGYAESNIPGVEIKHDSQSSETTNVGYKVTQNIFEHYDEVIVLTWKRDFESSAVNCSETTHVKNATAHRILPADK